MADEERDQGPHYIPDLDPSKESFGKGAITPGMLFLMLFGGLALLIAAGAAWHFGLTALSIGFLVAALILWALLLITSLFSG